MYGICLCTLVLACDLGSALNAVPARLTEHDMLKPTCAKCQEQHGFAFETRWL